MEISGQIEEIDRATASREIRMKEDLSCFVGGGGVRSGLLLPSLFLPIYRSVCILEAVGTKGRSASRREHSVHVLPAGPALHMIGFVSAGVPI